MHVVSIVADDSNARFGHNENAVALCSERIEVSSNESLWDSGAAAPCVKSIHDQDTHKSSDIRDVHDEHVDNNVTRVASTGKSGAAIPSRKETFPTGENKNVEPPCKRVKLNKIKAELFADSRGVINPTREFYVANVSLEHAQDAPT